MILLDQAVYTYSMVSGLLIVLLLIVASIFELKGLVRVFFTLLSIIFVSIHYSIVYYMTAFEAIHLYPFIIVEETTTGGSISIDIGQLVVASLIILWRREIAGLLRRRPPSHAESAPGSTREGGATGVQGS